MKTILLFVALLATARAFPAPLEVWCGVAPLAALVQNIGGTRVEAHSLLAGARDPCVYSPSPRAVAAMRQADLFLTAGMSFEQAVAQRVQAMNPGLVIIDVSEGIETGGDPHVWMSLTALSAMAGRIAEALVELDPHGAEEIERNRRLVQRDLGERHQRLQEILAPYRGTTFYIVHPVLGGFARDYGLIQQAVEIDGRSPSPRRLLALIHRARDEGVRLVFVQPQFSDRPGRLLADRIGGRTVSINPLAEEIAAELERAAREIKDAYASQE